MKKTISMVLLLATVLFISCKDTNPVLVTDVKINKDVLSLALGTKEVLIVTVNPKNADDQRVIWSSSDASVATVSTTGEVSPLKEGTTTITVTSNSDNTKKATCLVTVEPVKVTSVTLNKANLTINMGNTETLVASVFPENATYKGITWSSSDINVAKVSELGVVTPVKAGTTTISITSNTDNTKKATCEVTVEPVKVTSVTLNKANLTINMGNTETLVASVFPENATDKGITWSSSDINVAKVSELGVVTPLRAGTTTISITSNADQTKKATCAVTVVVVDVTSVTLNKADLTINMGNTETLVASVFPENATYKGITWSSSDINVAKVSELGVVTPVKAGTTTISITSNTDQTKKATCAVTVVAVDVTSVDLSKADLTIKMGNTATLVASVNPKNATDKGITWKSSDVNVATVSELGVVTPVGVGTSIITITSTSDKTKKAACVVVVEAAAVPSI